MPENRQFAQTLASGIHNQITEHLAPVKCVEEASLMAAHQDAENALAMALHYLRAGAGNVPGAMRKAVQALSALNTLQIAGAGRRPQIGGAA